jgi:hypothetical protein
MPVWLTLVAGAALSAAPTFISFLPPPVSAMVTAIVALGSGAYHYFQPAPGQAADKPA